MTRFARAKGSKASNERVEEDATSWAEMKTQMEEKKTEAEDEVKRKLMENERSEKYKKFLEEEWEGDGSEKKLEWADFPEMGITQRDGKKKMTGPGTAKKVEVIQHSSPLELDTKKKKKSKKVKDQQPDVEEKNVEIELNEKQVKLIEVEPKKKCKKVKKAKEIPENQETKSQPKNKRKLDNTDSKEAFKRRKPDSKVEKVSINGKDVQLVYFDGFPIKKDDAERLTALRKQMISKGLPRSEVKAAMKLERRRAEKSLSRDKKNVCFNCRKSGHVLSECPEIDNNGVESAVCGICFKCGSTEHTHFQCRVVKSTEFRFATCFICKEQGHIARQCPDNARGLYPKGGACKLCGDVTHLKKDCPQHVAEQEANNVTLERFSEDIEGLEGQKKSFVVKNKPNKVIKF